MGPWNFVIHFVINLFRRQESHQTILAQALHMLGAILLGTLFCHFFPKASQLIPVLSQSQVSLYQRQAGRCPCLWFPLAMSKCSRGG